MIFNTMFVKCACCGQHKEFDEGGVPVDPRHPYYDRFVCDACLDQLDFQPDHCSDCIYYMAVNDKAGICIRHYRSGIEKEDAAAGYDDWTAPDDWCGRFHDKNVRCSRCEHFRKGYCDILPPAGYVQCRKQVKPDEWCSSFQDSYENVK